MKTALLAFLSILLSVAAQFFLKAGMSTPAAKQFALQGFAPTTFGTLLIQPAVIVGFLLYGLGAAVWLLVLSQWEVSKAYPMVGFGFVLTLAAGFALGEAVTSARALGVLLICTGVFLIGRT